MKEFITKFFGYTTSEGGVSPYSDGLGKGAFSDWRHYLWMILVIIICISLYHLFKKYKKAGRTFVMIAVALLFSTRLINQTVRAFIGAESPVWKAFPFHMCTVLTFLMPIVAFFNIKKLKTAVYVLSILGGTITVILGDYFDSKFLNFSNLEGMSAHTLLILIPIIEIAIGNFKLEVKKSWQVILGIIVMMGWATLANEVFFKGYDNNYMYLVTNGLPGNFGGDYFFFIYMFIFIFMMSVVYGSPILYKKFKTL